MDAIRFLRRRRRTRQAVAHLDARLLRDAGLERFSPPSRPKPFWWLWGN